MYINLSTIVLLEFFKLYLSLEDIIELANIELVYWSVRSSSKRGVDGIRGVEEGNSYLSPLEVPLQVPNNTIIN